jgi:hypothetical protein
MEIDTVVHVYEPLLPQAEEKPSDDVVLAKSCAWYCIPYMAMVLTAALCGYYFWK